LKMLPDALNKGSIFLFKSSEPEIYKDGDQLRDFIYVKDAVKMTAQFLENDLTGIFNLGTGLPRSWNDLARAVISSIDRKATIEYIEMPKDLHGKYQNYTAADMKKSKEAKLILPSYSLEESVKDYVQNYLLKRDYF
jgi:ADP-L-glycero-D-manno-heptose 6-epimerase